MPHNDLSQITTFPSTDAKQCSKAPITQPFGLKLRFWGWMAFKYLIIFIIIYSATNWWRQPIMPADPELQLTDYHGQAVDIEAMSYKTPVLVYFWGTWCGVCSVTSPTIESLAQSSPYSVISIAVTSGNNQTLDTYMQVKGYEFDVINDDSGAMFDSWQGQVTPSYVILNEGRMTQGLTGIQPEWSLKLRLWLSSWI